MATSGSERWNPFDDARQAETYDEWFATPVGARVDRFEKRALYHAAQWREHERVLEVGTGTGHWALDIARRGPGVIGVDQSRSMLAVARQKSAILPWVCADGVALPFPDATFDATLAVTVLEFVADPHAVVSEMFRVTAPGGRVVVGVLNARGPWADMYRRLGRDPASPFYEARFLELDELLALLGRFGDVGTRGAVFTPPVAAALPLAWPRELLGAALWPRRGAFLVGRVIKRCT